MTISSTTVKNSYSGNGTLDTFNYTFKIFADADIQVIIRDATATETVKTLTTHYTVTGAGSASGGTIVFTAGNIPTATETVVIRRASPQTQAIDYIANDPFPAESHEEGLDRSMMAIQQLQEEVDRSIKLSRTNTMNSTEFTIGDTDRANKVFGFDASGELTVAQELGTFKGNWSSGTTFAVRDIIKDTSNNNVYICLTAHTSSGSQPISTNADVAKWGLLVDAASATSSATAAAASATAAATSETNAATSESNAATSETNSANSATASANSATSSASSATASASSATAAAGSASAAEATFDLFDDSYLGAKASNPTVDNDGDALQDGALYFDTTNDVMKVYNLANTTWYQLTPTVSNQTNINTVAGISSDVSSVAGISSDVTTTASNTTNISTVAGQITPTNNVSTVAGVSSSISTLSPISSNITTVAGISSDVTSVANISTAVSNVNSNSTNINTVASDLAGSNNIGTVAGSIANVNLTGGSIANVNTVAGIDGNITTVAGISADVTSVAGISTAVSNVNSNSSNINAVNANSANINAVAGDATDIGTVATDIANVNTVAGISSDVTTVANDGTDIGTVATNIANVNLVGGSITNVNNVGNNISGVNSFAERYRVGASDPTTSLDAGDLAFNTTGSVFKYYDGSAWQQITAGGITELSQDTTPELGGDLGLNSNDITGTGNINITGNVSLTGTVDGRDIASDGTKLDGIESGATADQSNAEIKTAYEANSDTNAFTDAEKTKLSGIATGATANTGTVTSVGISPGTGLDAGSAITTSGNISVTLDLSELTDMTADVVGANDELILLDSGAERRKAINEIKLSQFNNDSGFTSNTGDITGVTAGDGLTGGGTSGSVTLNVVGGTGITANANDIAIDSTVVTTTGSQTLTNKSIAASQLTGSLPAIDGSALTGISSGEASVEAWVNFNGTNMSVRDSGNVSSVSDNGTGEFIVNFSTSFANTNYVFAGAGRDVNTNTSILGAVNYGRSDNIKETGRCEICSYNDATNTLTDQPEINATFFYG